MQSMRIYMGKKIIGYNNYMDDITKEIYKNDSHILFIKCHVNSKGIKTFQIDSDDCEVIETGTQLKNGKIISFQKYRSLNEQKYG